MKVLGLSTYNAKDLSFKAVTMELISEVKDTASCPLEDKDMSRSTLPVCYSNSTIEH